MADPQNSQTTPTTTKPPNPPQELPFSGQKLHYPHPPDSVNPDAATLREQWKYAIRQYSKWYSHAWGTAILAGVSFFALGWFVKGSNPIPSFHRSDEDDGTGSKFPQGQGQAAEAAKEGAPS